MRYVNCSMRFWLKNLILIKTATILIVFETGLVDMVKIINSEFLNISTINCYFWDLVVKGRSHPPQNCHDLLVKLKNLKILSPFLNGRSSSQNL
jgi:hypothetical protein